MPKFAVRLKMYQEETIVVEAPDANAAYDAASDQSFGDMICWPDLGDVSYEVQGYAYQVEDDEEITPLAVEEDSPPQDITPSWVKRTRIL